MTTRNLELLSPAGNAEIAVEAILHGADAVYIGPPSHGARKAASNSLEDIEKVVDFAHQYRAKVYATVNTIVYDSEIKAVETLCRDLYHIGVDALIVQDMGILRMKIPPIALHASTQCDIRTPEKARFLENVGFSQLVLARELTLTEIKEIADSVSIPVETFIHGALCVSYSGKCHASWALTGRSANRGECAQICRYPYSLTDSTGKTIYKDKYLLSLKDFNASHNLKDLIEAGVSSFKIEGRLKDVSYVKNITALYSKQLNKIITSCKGKYRRSSFGEVTLKFSPQADKSFNRGFTNYFIEQRNPIKIASLQTPKSQGEKINDLSQLNNGDGISFFDKSGNFTGVNINRVDGKKIITAQQKALSFSSGLYRTSDIQWDKIMATQTAVRKIKLDIFLHDDNVYAVDERGVDANIPLDLKFEVARQKPNYKEIFSKLGNSIYVLNNFSNSIDPTRFYRASELTALRRRLIEELDEKNKKTYEIPTRRPEDLEARYPIEKVDYSENVSNSLAKQFYMEHGVLEIENSAETSGKMKSGKVVMTTRHCILRELGKCKKEKGNPDNFRFPLFLDFKGGRFRLDFDCNNCQMKVVLP